MFQCFFFTPQALTGPIRFERIVRTLILAFLANSTATYPKLHFFRIFSLLCIISTLKKEARNEINPQMRAIRKKARKNNIILVMAPFIPPWKNARTKSIFESGLTFAGSFGFSSSSTSLPSSTSAKSFCFSNLPIVGFSNKV